ncbi:MAG: hypothetical protein E7618_06845, partial [Ruminococcaceae bacterium]|nr:hypothetical protein [Oscillospiraceae bacterium]
MAENCVFGRGFSGSPYKKRSFLLFQKFLGCRGFFSKIPLAGAAGAEPLRLEAAFSPPRGAAPWNPAPFFERKEQRSDMVENCVFGRNFSGLPCKKRSFLRFQKFLGCRGIFSKIPLAGVTGAEPLRLEAAFSPQGALPLGTPLLSLKERSKEADIPKTAFSAGISQKFPCKKRSFLLFQKFLGCRGFFSKIPLAGVAGAEPLRLETAFLPPRGAAPWNPASFFERKKQRSDMAENCVFGRGFSGSPCKKRSFLRFQKFLGCR